MSLRRSFAVAAVALAALSFTACAPDAPPTTQPGDWPGAKCVDGAGTDGSEAPDLKFSGTPNVRGNAVISASIVGGEVVLSGNGTCSGSPVAATTIVRAADEAAAAAQCDALGAGDTATSYTGSPWTLPADAWACSETYWL